MPQPGSVQDTTSLVIANNGTKPSAGALIDNCAEIGLFVPALSPSSVVTVQVAETDTDLAYFGLVNQAGTAILVLASSAGGYVVSGNELGACLSYKYLRVVCGTAQSPTVTFTLKRKWTGHQQVG